MSTVVVSGKLHGVKESGDKFRVAGSRAWQNLKEIMDVVGEEMRTTMYSIAAGEIDSNSGRLLRAIYNRNKENDDRQTITATVGVARRAFYGGILNVGVAGKTVSVKSYVRRVKATSIRQNRKKIAQGIGFVSGYDRTLSIRARPFIDETAQTLGDKLAADIYRGLTEGLADVVGG